MVALTPAAGLRSSPETHQQAPFLAQLLATKDQHPQTRERRRAAPEDRHRRLSSHLRADPFRIRR